MFKILWSIGLQLSIDKDHFFRFLEFFIVELSVLLKK
jgi:hypothetical protein